MKDIHKENSAENEVKVDTGSGSEFNIDSLPSRKELHGKKKQRTKIKIKFPFVKLLALFFVLLLGTVWAIASMLTKDEAAPATSEGKDSSYTESIGEISGFDDEEEAEAEEVVKEESSNEEDKAIAEEKENVVAVEQDVEEKVETEKQEVEVSTTETATKDDGNKQETQQTTSSPQSNNEVVQHVVKSNENLFRIALKYYSSADGVEIIKQYNGLKGNDIVVGQVLKIPPR